MFTTVHPITILGAGNIGFALALLLQRSGSYAVRVADRDAARLARVAALGCETTLLRTDDDTASAIDGQYAVLNALPFRHAPAMAQLCARRGVHYFDLTEDVASTQAIQRLGADASSVLMPQCGLAPGFIGVVGHDLAARFDSVLDVKMRVGALPRFPTNALRYNLTWSTEGLINEYCNPCDAIVEGEKARVLALEGLETFVLDGVAYEAFSTSGGLGTLPDTLLGRARSVDYKSIRYPGHRQVLKLLLDDLRLRDRRDLLCEIFEQALPATQDDVIVILASATGHRDGRLTEETFTTRILGTRIDGHALSAIQLSTACGMCAALDLVVAGDLPQRGFVRQEAIALDRFLANRFGRIYGGQELAASRQPARERLPA